MGNRCVCLCVSKCETRDSAGLNLANLRRCLGENLVRVDAAGKRSGCKALQPIAKRPEGVRDGSFSASSKGFAIDQHDVAADAELRIAFGQLHRLGKSRPVGHQRRGSDDAARMSLHDGAIHPRSKSEIVRIDNEPAQAASLATEPRV